MVLVVIHYNSHVICTRLNFSSSMVGNMTGFLNACINVNLHSVLKCFLACGMDSSEIKDHTICTDCKKNI